MLYNVDVEYKCYIFTALFILQTVGLAASTDIMAKRKSLSKTVALCSGGIPIIAHSDAKAKI
jgi:hypothetical protein